MEQIAQQLKMKNKLIFFGIIFLIFPLISSANYSSGIYDQGLYGIGETPSAVIASTSGGGGGGSASSSTTIIPDILITPLEINVNLAVNTNKEYSINIKNPRSNKIILQISQNNLNNMILLSETLLEINPGESKNLKVIFVALNKTGIFTGKIIIGNKEVLISLNIKTKLLLFDSNIVVLNKDYKVEQGEKLKTKVGLIPMGDKNRLDVTLNYVIKDYNGKIYLTKSETLLVEEKMDFEREFDTGGLPVKEYIVGLELIYPNGVAPSSAYFEVTKRKSLFSPLKKISSRIWFIIGMISLFNIILI